MAPNRDRRWFRALKWGDWLMYGVIGLLSVVLFISSPDVSGKIVAGAVLIQDGQTIEQWSIEELNQGGTVHVDANAYHYKIDYADGHIRFAEANCPDQVCVITGWISRPGQIAVCVPGHLMLKINANAADDPSQSEDVDVIIR